MAIVSLIFGSLIGGFAAIWGFFFQSFSVLDALACHSAIAVAVMTLVLARVIIESAETDADPIG